MSSSTSSMSTSTSSMNSSIAYPVQLNILGCTGLLCTIATYSDQTLLSVKQSVFEQIGFPTDEQRILLGSQELQDIQHIHEIFQEGVADVLLIRSPCPQVLTIIDRLENGTGDLHKDIQALRSFGARAVPAIPKLEEYLASDDLELRLQAVQTLCFIGVPAVPSLLVALGDADDSIRGEASFGLGELGVSAAPAVPAFIKTLREHKDGNERYAAARSLGHLGVAAESAAQSLVNALADENAYVCRAAGEALARIGKPALNVLQMALANHQPIMRERAASCIGQLGVEAVTAVPALTQTLADSDIHVRKAAVGALGKLLGPSAVKALGKALADTDDGVRLEAINKLFDAGELAALVLRAICAALSDRSRAVVMIAAKTIARLGPLAELAIPSLGELLASDVLETRLSAVKALRKLGKLSAPIVPALRRSLCDDNVGVRREAAALLMFIQETDDAALAELIRQLEPGSDPKVKLQAVAIFSELGRLALPAIETINMAAVQTENLELRMNAIVLLQSLGQSPMD